MKKLRVFPTVKKRRIVSGFSIGNPGTILFLCLLMPYVITSFFGNIKGMQQEPGEAVEAVSLGGSLMTGNRYVSNQTLLGQEQIPLELYIADLLERTMGEAYETEALKAQAVLIRSNLYFQREQGSGMQEGGYSVFLQDEKYGSVRITEKVRQAVIQTKGVYLAYQDRPAAAPYFLVSNGATRNAQELGLTDYPYIKSVVCKRDFLSEDFSSSVRISQSRLYELWEQMPLCRVEEERLQELNREEAEGVLGMGLYRDSIGYVLYVESQGKYVAGEEFRSCLHLSSAGFHLEAEEGEIRILCKGAGHGLGMSQFSANQMALEGKDYIDILSCFFQDTTITKTE